MNAPNINKTSEDSAHLGHATGISDMPQVILIFTLSPTANTYLSAQRGAYPYHIGRLLKNAQTPAEMAMLLLQCTSGGLFEHDRITLKLTAKSQAIASVKHAAATVVHSSREAGYAESTIDVVAENNAYLEYIGNINIMFPSSALTNNINVRLHNGATILISDTYLMHDPDAQGKHFADLETSMRVISANETLLTLDRLHITGPDLAIQLTAVDIEFDTHSTIYLLMGDSTDKQIADMLESIHTAINNLAIKAEEAYIGVGTLPNQCGLFVRLLSHSGEPVNHLVKALSALARQHHFNQ